MIIDAQQLRDAVSAAICDRSTLDVLEFIRVRPEVDNRLSLCSTNLELEREDWVTFTGSVEVDTPEAGAGVCIHGAKLKAALQGLAGDVKLSLGWPACILSQGRRRYRLDSREMADFPAAQDEEAKDLDLDAGALGDALLAVMYARAKPGRVHGIQCLVGVHVGGGYVSATNGNQLARRALEMGGGLPDQGVVLPAESVAPMARLLAMDGARVSLLGPDGYPRGVAVTTAAARLQTKLIDGVFPNLNNVMPRGEPLARFRFDAAAPAPCLTRLLPLAERITQKFRTATMALKADPDGGAVMLCVDDDTHDLFEVEDLDGDLNGALVNGQYLAETCKTERGTIDVQVFEMRGARALVLNGLSEHVISGIRA